MSVVPFRQSVVSVTVSTHCPATIYFSESYWELLCGFVKAKENMDKYSKPSLPNPRSVLEDLNSLDVEDTQETLKFTSDEELLGDAYNCYLNYKQLKNDISEQQQLSSTLEELNKELMDNIENMRKQQSAND